MLFMDGLANAEHFVLIVRNCQMLSSRLGDQDSMIFAGKGRALRGTTIQLTSIVL